MYIQITTRCNMSCSHCGFSCTHKGEDMSLATFRDALTIDGYITLGGGEPTLHKDFDTMLLEALAAVHGFHGDGQVSVITNGSITNRALVLAQLGKAEVIHAQVSRDIFHDEIDPRVVKAFESFKSERYNTTPGVRNTTAASDPLPYGRAMEILEIDAEDIERDGSDCLCDDFVIKPSGTIHHCGCPDSPIVGSTRDGIKVPMDAYHECCHSNAFIQACLGSEEYEHLLD